MTESPNLDDAIALDPVDLADVGPDMRRDMAAAGAAVRRAGAELAESGSNVVAEMLRGAAEFFEWDHYSVGDIYDWESHSQYYYHAHPAENRRRYFADEHGHFHTFLRAKGMPAGMVPAPVADFRPLDDENDMLTHFVAIAMDSTGEAIGLFTTNRWVTGETWYAAEDVISMLDRFGVAHERPASAANRWITGMLALFRPDIEMLLRRRDAVVAARAEALPAHNVYEDRGLEVTAYMDISVAQRIAGLGET
jgi:hypothetical protein